MIKNAPDKNHNVYMVPGLKRGITLLRLLNNKGNGMLLSEISDSLEISRSSAFRVVYTLEYLGLVEKNKNNQRFFLTSEVLKLGFEYLSTHSILEIAQVQVDALRDKTNLSSNICGLEGSAVVILYRSISSHGFAGDARVGTQRPVYAHPLGSVLLSETPKNQLKKIMSGVKFERLTSKTPKNMKEFESVMEAVRKRGYMHSDGILVPGVSSVGAPVRDATGNIVLAINVFGPTEFVSSNFKIEKLAEEVCKTASEISERLGYNPDRHERKRAMPLSDFE